MPDRLEFDDEASRAVEAVYSTDDVAEQRRATLRELALQPGERVLDIGSGPGLLAREMAEAVGARGLVHGVDLSPSMLALARGRSQGEGAAPLEFSEQPATALSFPGGAFDVVVSTQVYEYVDDIAAALAEARRVLVAGGRLAVVDSDWDSIVWHSGDPGRMGRVLEAWDEHLAHRDLPRRLPELLATAGFALESCRVIPMLNVGYSRASYSAGLLELIAGFVAGRRGVTAEEAAGWAEDLRRMGSAYFFSLNRYLFLASPTSA